MMHLGIAIKCKYLLIATQLNQYMSISINANHIQTYLIFLNQSWPAAPTYVGIARPCRRQPTQASHRTTMEVLEDE